MTLIKKQVGEDSSIAISGEVTQSIRFNNNVPVHRYSNRIRPRESKFTSCMLQEQSEVHQNWYTI